MTIKIYDEYDIMPDEVWKDYPFLPNIGDKVQTNNLGVKIVKQRIFKKDYVDIRLIH